MKKYCVALFLMLLGPIGGIQLVAADNLSKGEVLLNEILPATQDSASKEFIELYNTTDQDINLTDWKIQYASSASSTWKTLSNLTFNVDFISASSYYLLSSSAYSLSNSDGSFAATMAQSGGQLRIIDANADVQDQVSWGNAASMAQSSPAPSPAAGQSLSRLVADSAPKNTNNNFADFAVSDQPSPGVTNQQEPAANDENPVNTQPASSQSASPQPSEVQENYPALLITELLPDPTSPQTDASDEFVELYNPNLETVDLSGYIIFTGNNDNYKYKIPEGVIEPGEYITFYAHDSHLALSNSGGRAKLLAPNGVQLDITQPYGSAPEGQSWIRDDSNWLWSNSPTPGEANQLSEAETANQSPVPATSSSTGFAVVEISELLPNPASPQTDADDEYIELHNLNNFSVDLTGYTIIAGTTSSYEFKINNLSAGPGSYLVFYSRDTSLTLSNSGGQAKLLAPDDTIISQTDIYQSATEGQAWIFAGGKWQWSSSATPGQANIYTAPAKANGPKAASAKKAAAKAPKKATTAAKKSVKGASTSSTLNNPSKNDRVGILPPLVLAGVAGLVLLYGLYEYRTDLANRFHKFRRYREARAAAGGTTAPASRGGIALRLRGWQNNLRSRFGPRLRQ